MGRRGRRIGEEGGEQRGEERKEKDSRVLGWGGSEMAGRKKGGSRMRFG